jgi:hypothetical protein
MANSVTWNLRFNSNKSNFVIAGLILAAAGVILPSARSGVAQQKDIIWSEREKPILHEMRGLRALRDDMRGETNKRLALQIRALPVAPNKFPGQLVYRGGFRP